MMQALSCRGWNQELVCFHFCPQRSTPVHWELPPAPPASRTEGEGVFPRTDSGQGSSIEMLAKCAFSPLPSL